MNAARTIPIPAPSAEPAAAAEAVLLDVAAAAKALSVSERTLHRLTVPDGDLPCVRIGTRKLYRPQALAEWAIKHEEAR